MRSQFFLILLFAFNISTQAKTITAQLTTEESDFVEALAKKYEIEPIDYGSCSETSFKVIDRIRGLNPNTWSLVYNKAIFSLVGEDFSMLNDISMRLEVPYKSVDSMFFDSEIKFSTLSCEFTKSTTWTASFENLE